MTQNTHDSVAVLPPLPVSTRTAWPHGWHYLYDADQMRAYAIAALQAQQGAPQGGEDGVVPLDLEQHEREALNYLGSALKDRNSKRAVDKALALCDFYAGRSQLTFCHRDLLQRKLLPAAAPAVAKMWFKLVEQIAEPLNCRASEHVDANAHVIAAARRLTTQPQVPEQPAEQGAVVGLAAMDGLLAFASRGVERDDPARQMIEAAHEALATLAELIEQAQRCCDGVGDLKDLRAALARIGGGK